MLPSKDDGNFHVTSSLELSSAVGGEEDSRDDSDIGDIDEISLKKQIHLDLTVSRHRDT